MVIPLFGIDSTVCRECPYLNVRGTVFSKTISVVATPQKKRTATTAAAEGKCISVRAFIGRSR